MKLTWVGYVPASNHHVSSSGHLAYGLYVAYYYTLTFNGLDLTKAGLAAKERSGSK